MIKSEKVIEIDSNEQTSTTIIKDETVIKSETLIKKEFLIKKEPFESAIEPIECGGRWIVLVKRLAINGF